MPPNGHRDDGGQRRGVVDTEQQEREDARAADDVRVVMGWTLPSLKGIEVPKWEWV